MRSLLGTPTLVPRTTRPGDRLAMVALTGGRSPIGIDLESGAFVAPVAPRHVERRPLACFDVAVGRLAAPSGDDVVEDRPFEDGVFADDTSPETVLLEAPLRKVGRLTARRASRYFRPLLHPHHGPILGFHGPAAPFWSIDGTRPSVSLLRPDNGMGVVVNEDGVSLLFRWCGVLQTLPLEAQDVLARLDWMANGITTGEQLRRALGYEPRYAVVSISEPRDGYCYKVVSGLVPRS
jgi:hypothetical protein